MKARTPKVPGQEHPITIEPAGQRIIVRVGDRVVADTTAALTLKEAGYRPCTTSRSKTSTRRCCDPVRRRRIARTRVTLRTTASPDQTD